MTKEDSESRNSLSKLGKDVSLRRRIEVLEEDLYKLKEEISLLRKEIEKIKDFIGMSN